MKIARCALKPLTSPPTAKDLSLPYSVARRTCLQARMYIMYHCWRQISNYSFTALGIFKTILVFFGVVEAPQDYGRGGYTYSFMNKIYVIYVLYIYTYLGSIPPLQIFRTYPLTINIPPPTRNHVGFYVQIS